MDDQLKRLLHKRKQTQMEIKNLQIKLMDTEKEIEQYRRLKNKFNLKSV